jgi:glutamate carboxypeptidase
VSVNAGIVRGGTRPNIVPDAASLTLDLRARRRADQEQALRAIEAIAADTTVPGTTATLEHLASHWPMERTPASDRLAELAVSSAASLGIALGHTATGGASDGNTTAALGVPTLDGLGPVGGGAHAPDEYLELDSVEPRTALLASLLRAIGRDASLRRGRG